ncbi:endonuclease domain-containing protein [Candidatus Peregrinibacteria bacterium]|nr:endonuclease domain-containing protein [Candidatus Peregrinibacteria bacterium]
MLVDQHFVDGSTRKAQYLRKHQTTAEKILWRRLRNRQLYGLKFRRQFPIGKYVVDFMCLDSRLAIELDGNSHQFREKTDMKKQIFLEQQGFTLLRYSNNQIKFNLEMSLVQIAQKAGIPEQEIASVDPFVFPSPRGRGQG